MHIFIDESGIHKKDGVSSVVLVYISVDDINALNKEVVRVEEELNIYPFHWAYSAWNVRSAFIEAISKLRFSVKVAIIKNPFYEKTAYEYVLRHLVVELNIASIVIDGKKTRSYEHKLKKILREKGVGARKLITGNDEGYPALRVADALAGLSRFMEESPHDKKIKALYDKIKYKIGITVRK